MGYNNGNGRREPAPASVPMPTLKRSRAERIRHFALFAALPLVLGALAGGVTLALPGDPGAALRDVFSAVYINGVAAITVAGVLQMWFTMGETQRADYEQARADWERARADNEQAKARSFRAKAEEMRLLMAEEQARIAAIVAARAAVESASATISIIGEESSRADSAAATERDQYDALIAAAESDERVELQREQAVRAGQRAEYAAQVSQEMLRAMRNLNESQQVLNRLLTDHSNGSGA